MPCTIRPLVIWLGQHIVEHDQCQTLHAAFSTRSSVELIPTNLRNNTVEIAVFNDAAACIEYLRNNKDKRIFLIVSSSLGEEHVHQIIEKLLPDQNFSIYVLCADVETMRTQLDDDQQQYVQILTVQTSLLARVAFAIGDYFVSLGDKHCAYKTAQSVCTALEFFNSAKTLLKRAHHFDSLAGFEDRQATLDEHIAQATRLLRRCVDDRAEIDRCIAVSADMANYDPRTECENQLAFKGAIPAEYDSTTLSDCAKEQLLEKNSEIRILLLQSSFQTDTFQFFASSLSELIGETLMVVRGHQDYHQLVKSCDTPLIVLSLATASGEQVLEQMTSLRQPPSTYVLGAQPTTENEREVFFSKHHSVCAMSNDPQELFIRVAVDLAMQNRILGDRYARVNNKYCAEQKYDQCIKILYRLNEFAERNASSQY